MCVDLAITSADLVYGSSGNILAEVPRTSQKGPTPSIIARINSPGTEALCNLGVFRQEWRLVTAHVTNVAAV